MTVRVAVAWWTIAPLVPFTVNVNVPRGVLPLVLTVIEELPEGVTEGGLKVAVVPDGSPSTERVTVPENPACDETVML